MSRTAPGVVVAGHGVASGADPDSPFPAGTIELQAPHFAARGLDLSPFVMATVNLDLAPRRLVLLEPAWTFTDVVWTDVHPGETFSFVQALVSRSGAKGVPGLIYHPHPETKPRHHQPPTVIELLLPRLAHLRAGEVLRVEVAEGQARLVGPSAAGGGPSPPVARPTQGY